MVIRDVNLRAAPSTTAQVIASLKQGTAVTILDRRGNWDRLEVVISGQISRQGWAYGSYIGETDKNPAAKP
jgi:SH3-like domain-containing protein